MSLSLKLSINGYKLRNFFTRKVQITISGIMNHTQSEKKNYLSKLTDAEDEVEALQIKTTTNKITERIILSFA